MGCLSFYFSFLMLDMCTSVSIAFIGYFSPYKSIINVYHTHVGNTALKTKIELLLMSYKLTNY